MFNYFGFTSQIWHLCLGSQTEKYAKWEILKREKELVPLHREQLGLAEDDRQRDGDSAILLNLFP